MTIETTTIDSLPNEVILVVFLWTKAYADLRGDDHFGPPSCVDLSHVSRRWRSLALACQELWTNWPRYGAAIPWTEVCRERSSTASLDLCLLVGSESEFEPPAAAVMHLATENLARARSILIRPHPTFGHYMTDPGPVMQTILQLSFESAPILENLRLENPHEMIRLPFIGAPLLFAAQELPHLKQLSLRGYLVSVSDTMHMSSLSTLNIQFASAWSNADQMIQFLKGMPNLEELTYLYDDSGEGYDDDDDDDDDDALHSTDKAPSTTHSIRCVPFPRMKRLRLPRRGGFKSAALLFSYCAFAPQTALCFEADTFYLDWDAHLELAANALRDHFAEAIAQGQSYDVITVNNRIIKPDISRQTSPSHALPADLSLSIPHSSIDIGYPDKVLKPSCELYLSLPIFTGASELHVTRDSCYGFLKLYPPLPVLRVLVMKRDAIAEVMNHLSNCSHQFPALEVLRLADFDCHTTAAALIRPKSRDTIARDIVKALCACLYLGSTKTWRYVEFERFRYGEYVAEKIRSEPELQDLNERVEIRCIDCYD